MKRRYLANKKEFTVRQVRLIMDCLGACLTYMSSEWGIHSPGACPVHSLDACPVHDVPGWDAWHEAIKGGIGKIIENCKVLHSIAHLQFIFVVRLHR